MAYTTIDNPELHFQAKVYTADSSANRLITLDGSENMQPDWVWMKNRDQSVNHDLYDSVRGTTKYISSNKINAEATNADGLVGFNTDGFTVDTSWGNISTGNSYVAWCWKAGGSASNNTDGTTTVSLSLNLTAGFSIGTYTGTSAAATIGHGLGAVPHWIMIKNRSSGSRKWAIWHNDLSGTNKYLAIDRTDAELTDTATWNNTAHTSSVFASGGSGEVNQGSENFVFYAFKPIKGYSKFGSYTGNGNADGTFVYTGFKPAWLMIKQINSGGNDWLMYDNKRDTFNVANKLLVANANGTEATGQSFNYIDLLSNGFKLRGSDARNNGSGGTMIYMAFAESPFVNSNGVPNNAK
jgi:hypothetical protein